MASAYKPLPFSYIAPSQHQAPKTGFRKEEDIYGNLASSVVDLNDSVTYPSTVSDPVAVQTSATVPGGSHRPPPTAAKPKSAAPKPIATTEGMTATGGLSMDAGVVRDHIDSVDPSSIQPEVYANVDINSNVTASTQRLPRMEEEALTVYGNWRELPNGSEQQQQQPQKQPRLRPQQHQQLNRSDGRLTTPLEDHGRSPNSSSTLSLAVSSRPISVHAPSHDDHDASASGVVNSSMSAASPTYESAADAIRAAAVKNQRDAKIKAADEAARKNAQPLPAAAATRPQGFPAPVPTPGFVATVDLDTPTGGQEGGIFDNFILVGAGKTSPVDDELSPIAAADAKNGEKIRQQPANAKTRLDDVFTSGGKPQPLLSRQSGDYVSVEVERQRNGDDRWSYNRTDGDVTAGQQSRVERLPRAIDTSANVGVSGGVGANGAVIANDPSYHLYTGKETSVVTNLDQKNSPTHTESFSNSFNNADAKLVGGRSKWKTRSAARSSSGSEVSDEKFCGCSGCTQVLCVVIVIAIVIALVLFGIGIIIGWFAHANQTSAIVDASSTTSISSSSSSSSVAAALTSSITLSMPPSIPGAASSSTSAANTVTSSVNVTTSIATSTVKNVNVTASLSFTTSSPAVVANPAMSTTAA